MQRTLILISILSVSFYFGFAQSQPRAAEGQREVAITIDDLPVVSLFTTMKAKRAITEKILASLTTYAVPAIGFVNERKLYTDGRVDAEKVVLLQQWLAAGMELGNHAFAHQDYHLISFDEFAKDIEKGETTTQQLLAAQGNELVYFRHPYLHVGNSPEKKAQLEKYLKAHGYKVAPVTIDNQDWVFARAYDNALLAKDSTLAREIGATYVAYMVEVFAYYEQQSTVLFDREIKQTLLLHANTINSDYLDKLLAMIQKRGYAFISLDEALQDEAYSSADNYTGNGGISWLHRWALTQGKQGEFFKGEPEAPKLVHDVAALE